MTLRSPSLEQHGDCHRHCTSTPGTDSLDSVVGLHGPQEAVVKGSHEEALSEVVQMLAHCEHVVALPASTRVETTTLHARTEAADGVTLRQGRSLLQDS